MTGLYVGQAIGGFWRHCCCNFFFLAHHFPLVWYRRNDIFCGSDIFVEGEPRSYDCGTAVFCGGQRKEAVAVWRVEHVVLYLGILDYPFYFAAPSLPGWATKNWLPTLFSESLGIPMAEAGPISTITIALLFFRGRDSWRNPIRPLGAEKNIRGRVYTGAIGLGLTVPALMLLGFGSSFVAVIGAGLLFGIGFGIFDANNMPILCQFVSAKHRGTAYGIMNMTGVFAGAAVTQLLGKWTDGGSLGEGFAMLSIIVLIALALQLYFLRPKTDNME